jgi:hypothetical protein
MKFEIEANDCETYVLSIKTYHRVMYELKFRRKILPPFSGLETNHLLTPKR